MTDEEYQRLKDAEKEHLRAKKQLRSRLAALKKRSRAQSVVERMRSGAERLLEETGSLVETLRRTVIEGEARVDVALDDAGEDDLREAEEALREERAERLLRQYKSAQSTSTRSRRSPEDESGDAGSGTDPTGDGPEKTIGRMRTPRSDEAPEEE